MNDPADIFNRTRFLTAELASAAINIKLASDNIVRECARMIIAQDARNLADYAKHCDELGKCLRQAAIMQKSLARQIAREPRADVVDMRAVNIEGGRR